MGQDASTNQKFENVTSLTEEHFHQGLVLTEDLARAQSSNYYNYGATKISKENTSMLTTFCELKTVVHAV